MVYLSRNIIFTYNIPFRSTNILLMLFLKEKHKEFSLIILKVYVSADKKYFQYSTGQKIKVSEWDFNSSLPKKKTGEAGKENARLRGKLEKYTSLYQDLIKKRDDLTIFDFKQAFNEEFKGIKTISAEITPYPSDLFELFISELKISGTVQEETWEQYSNAYSTFIQFEKTTRKYRYAEINGELFPKYLAFVREEKDYQNSSMHRHFKFLKTFWHWAYDRAKQFKDFKPFTYKDTVTEKIALTEEDLDALYNLELTGRRAEVRDLFLVGCYTALRFSDMTTLDKNEMRNGFIRKYTEKTDTLAVIPIHDKLRRILEKYDYELPKAKHSQNFNELIQAICSNVPRFQDEIKITEFRGAVKTVREIPRWKAIGSHSCRRTMITISHKKGLPDAYIMKQAAIKSLKTLHNYVRINEDDFVKAIKGVWK